jgi:hypothetical protein
MPRQMMRRDALFCSTEAGVIKRIVLVLGALAIITSLRPAYLIGVSLCFWQPLSRPSSVSEGARYVATFKSAAWFDCVLDRAKDVDVCRAWDEEGNLIAFGNYRLDGENRAATEGELHPSSVHSYPAHPNLAWIHLSGDHGITEGRTLVPVNEVGIPLERFEVRIEND